MTKVTFKRCLILALITLTLTLTSTYIRKCEAATFTLTLSTDKKSYNIGESITANGTLSLDGTPMTDGLVSVQVNESDGNLWLIRTAPTGTNATTKKWSLQILGITPLPSQFLDRGDMLGLNITIKNNDPFDDHQTLIVVTLMHENSIPLKTKIIANVTMQANRTARFSFSNVLTIPNDTPNGNVEIYVNMLTALPSNGGWAWGLEGKTTITVGSSISSLQQTITQTTEGTYSLTFRTKDINAKLGNYTLYASTLYSSPPYAYRAQNSTTFEIILIGDVTGPDGVPDGKVDIRDVSLVAYSFGSYPGDPRWNPIADLYPDDKINIRDVAIVASNYGKIGILP